MKTGTSKSRCRGQTQNKTKNSAVKEVKNSEVLLFDWSLLQDYLEHTICIPPPPRKYSSSLVSSMLSPFSPKCKNYVIVYVWCGQWMHDSKMSEEVDMNEENKEEPSVNEERIDCSDAFNTSQVLI